MSVLTTQCKEEYFPSWVVECSSKLCPAFDQMIKLNECISVNTFTQKGFRIDKCLRGHNYQLVTCRYINV